MISGALQDTQTGQPGHLGGIPTEEHLPSCPPLFGAGKALGPLQTPALAGGGPPAKQEEVRTKEVLAVPLSPPVLKMTKLSSEGAQLHIPAAADSHQGPPLSSLCSPPPHRRPSPLPGGREASPAPRGK